MLVAQEAYNSQQEGGQSAPKRRRTAATESDSYTGEQEAGQVMQDVLLLVRATPNLGVLSLKDKQLDAPS